MVSCERCGSIRIVRVRSSTIDRAITAVTGRRLFLCRRCGWRARRTWADTELIGDTDQWSPVRAAPDPEMSVLDRVRRGSPQQQQRKRGSKKGRKPRRQLETVAAPHEAAETDRIDLSEISVENEMAEASAIQLDSVDVDQFQQDEYVEPNAEGSEEPHRSRARLYRTRRQQVSGMLALGAVGVSLLAMLMFAQSCRLGTTL